MSPTRRCGCVTEATISPVTRQMLSITRKIQRRNARPTPQGAPCALTTRSPRIILPMLAPVTPCSTTLLAMLADRADQVGGAGPTPVPRVDARAELQAQTTEARRVPQRLARPRGRARVGVALGQRQDRDDDPRRQQHIDDVRKDALAHDVGRVATGPALRKPYEVDSPPPVAPRGRMPHRSALVFSPPPRA